MKTCKRSKPKPPQVSERDLSIYREVVSKVLAKKPLKGHQIAKLATIPTFLGPVKFVWDAQYAAILDALVGRGVFEKVPDGRLAPFYRLAGKGGHP